MKQKNKCLITIVVLLFSVVINAKEVFTVEGLKYTIASTDDKTCIVTGIDDKDEENVQIPSIASWNGKTYSVTSIGENAFYDCDNLKTIYVPESVTEIGDDAFSGTAWYRNQPDGVIYINNVLYEYKGTMSEGTNIAVREGTVSISPSAFLGYDNLVAITFPGSMISIGEYAFYDCDNLKSVIIPENVSKIGWAAFLFCI